MLRSTDIPGSSVFRGENDIFIDNSAPRQEEEEFLEEEKNRQAELQNDVAKAFGDLEDDNSSISSNFGSSHNFQSSHSNEHVRLCNDERRLEFNGSLEHHSYISEKSSNQFTTNKSTDHRFSKADSAKPASTFETSNKWINNVQQGLDFESDLEAYKHTNVNNAAQLKILLDIERKENARLRSEIAIQKESVNIALRKLTTSDYEKQQIESSLDEKQTLYSECLDELKASNEEIARLREELTQTSQLRVEAIHELSVAKQQIALMEKCGRLKNQDKHIESVVEGLKEMHKREMTAVKKELDEALTKIRQKDESHQLLENKLVEIEERRTAMLINKCDSTVRQESAVEALLDNAYLQNTQLTKTILCLEAENNSLKKDLEFHESMTKNRLLSSTSSDEQECDKRSFARHCGDIKSTNNVDILKTELNRALTDQKGKRTEIRKLHEQIRAKEVQITQMREQEKAHYTEIDELKSNMMALMKRFEKGADENEKFELLGKIDGLEQLLSVLSKEKTNLADHVGQLEVEIENSKHKLAEQEKASLKVAQEYMAFHEREIERLNRENEDLSKNSEQEWRNRLQLLTNECNDIKKLYLEIRAARDSLAEQLDDEKKKIMDYAKKNKALEMRIKSLKRQVSDLEDHIIIIEEEKNEADSGDGQLLEEKKVDFMKRLKNEIDVLRRQNIDSTEVEKLRCHVSAAKQRYIDLEVSLTKEFETNVVELKKENENLKDELLKYTQRVEAFCSVATQTEALNPKTINVNSIGDEEMEKLHSEIERLHTLKESQSKEIMELKTSFQIRLQEKLEELEPKLMHQSYCETEAVKEEVKRITSQFYLVEMDKLRLAHKSAIDEFQAQKEEQSHKIVQLESQLQSELSKVEALEELKAQLIARQNLVEEVKTKSSLIIRNCAKEYEDLKASKKQLEDKMEALSSKTEKYKQSAFKYKKLFEQIKANDLPRRYQKLVALVESKELEIVNKIQEVSKAFVAQQKLPTRTGHS